MKRSFAMTAVLVTVLAVIGALAVSQYRQFTHTTLVVPKEFVLWVPKGASMTTVLSQLEAAGITQRDWRWRVFNRLNPSTIKAGEYALHSRMRPADLLRMLVQGNVLSHAFTIVEGWTFARLKEALTLHPVLEHELPQLSGDEELMTSLGQPGMHPEGWFLPETYHFVRGDSDLDILRRANKAMQEALRAAWSARSDVPLKSPYELLVLASIVEKETAVESERARVAGVFTRRLQKRWRLETDPTVIYGLGSSFDGDIRTKDLRTDTPYNTYTRYGLPPTPIALPGRKALEAVARPESGTAMFFVADGQGGHVFSDTLSEHNAAVRKLLDGG